MQKCFLVSGKSNMFREYFMRRSIIEVVDERRNLADIDVANIGIIDVDKFLYIYYGSDDNDLSFRTDLNIFRQLLCSPFFHTDECIFIFVDCANPMLEDYVKSACRGTTLVGQRLKVIHHKGALTLTDVSTYLVGDEYGKNAASTYKTVYVREAGSEEHNRFTNDASSLQMILPALTDQYAMYAKRAKVEAISSATMISDPVYRPQVLQDFPVRLKPTVKRWNAFLISGEQYTNFQLGTKYLTGYFAKMGLRTFIVDITTRFSNYTKPAESRLFTLPELAVSTAFSEPTAYIKARFNQLGYVFEMIDNVEGVAVYLFVCEPEDFANMCSFLIPSCDKLYTNYTTHFCAEALQDFIATGMRVSTLFLSGASIQKDFDILPYKEHFEGVRVARLFSEDEVDVVTHYESAVGVR